MIFENKRILITGGTGSLGKTLTRRLLESKNGKPKKIVIFSRDEAKQHQMRMFYKQRKFATDEIIYHNFDQLVEFRIGDVRDFASISLALKDVDIVFSAAALKQVPTCEYFPLEAVKTNIQGPANIVRAISEQGLAVETVVGVSTDKACKPINVMGMSKAIQERVFIQANMSCPGTRFVCARYGNVLASRGSVIPLFREQILAGGPLTITTEDMTRFLLTLDEAVDTVFAAVSQGRRGETYIPQAPSAKITDIADILIGSRKITKKVIGIRPGEKVHEILISEEECHRVISRGSYYVILPILPELRSSQEESSDFLTKEYSSADNVVSAEEAGEILSRNKLLLEDCQPSGTEILR